MSRHGAPRDGESLNGRFQQLQSNSATHRWGWKRKQKKICKYKRLILFFRLYLSIFLWVIAYFWEIIICKPFILVLYSSELFFLVQIIEEMLQILQKYPVVKGKEGYERLYLDDRCAQRKICVSLRVVASYPSLFSFPFLELSTEEMSPLPYKQAIGMGEPLLSFSLICFLLPSPNRWDRWTWRLTTNPTVLCCNWRALTYSTWWSVMPWVS